MSTRHDDSSVQPKLRAPTESATLWLVLGNTKRAMANAGDTLPEDIDALRAMILAERAAHASAHAAVLAERDTLVARNAALEASNATLATTNATLESANERLEQILAEIRRAHFGRKSERITADQ